MRRIFPGRYPPAGSVPLLFLACVIVAVHSMSAHANDSAPLRIACVGDSITYGLRIDDRAQHSYPAVLQRLAGDGAVVGNFGVSGTTLLKAGGYPYWSTAAFREATEFEPDVVIIKLGTNDTKFGNRGHHDAFADDLRALIEHFENLPSAPSIWLCYPAPMYGVYRSLNNRTLRRDLIPTIARVAEEKSIPVIDLYSALDGAPDYFPDGVHPNADGANTIAETVWDAIRDDLPRDSFRRSRPSAAHPR